MPGDGPAQLSVRYPLRKVRVADPLFRGPGRHAYSQASFRTTNGALIQLLPPDALRGRITSLQNYGQGFVRISSILIGLFAWYTSAPLASTVVGIARVSLAVVFLLASRTLRRLE